MGCCKPVIPLKKVCPPNPVDGLATCWDSSQQLYDLMKAVLLDVLATDPQALPQPPGVTNGQPAAAGYPGEVWSSSMLGTYSGANLSPPQINYVVLPDVLPAGDWDLQVQVRVNYAGSGSPQAAMLWFPTPLYPGMVNDGMVYLPNIPQAATPYPGVTGQPLVLVSPTLSVNINQMRGIVFNFAVWGSVQYPTGSYTANGFARRVR